MLYVFGNLYMIVNPSRLKGTAQVVSIWKEGAEEIMLPRMEM